MEETVIEPELFTESNFAEDQTENESSPAVEDSTKQPTSENEPVAEAEDSKKENANEPTPTDEIEEFLAKKGIKPDDPEALRKVADMYRNVEKDYSRKTQEKAKLERQIAEMNSKQPEIVNANDPMERIQALERRLAADRQLNAVREWKAAKNPSPEVEAKMIEYLEQPLISNGVPQTDNQGNPLTNNFLVNMGALSFDDVYKLVGGDSFKAEAVKEELKTAVANEIAAKQTAKSPSAMSTDSTKFTQPKTADDEFIDGLFN